MNKSTVKLITFKDHVMGYAHVRIPKQITEVEQLNKLVEWSRENLQSHNTIYRHVLRQEEKSTNRVYNYFGNGSILCKETYDEYMADELLKKFHRPYVVYYGEETYYLDIYWQ